MRRGFLIVYGLRQDRSRSLLHVHRQHAIMHFVPERRGIIVCSVRSNVHRHRSCARRRSPAKRPYRSLARQILDRRGTDRRALQLRSCCRCQFTNVLVSAFEEGKKTRNLSGGWCEFESDIVALPGTYVFQPPDFDGGRRIDSRRIEVATGTAGTGGSGAFRPRCTFGIGCGGEGQDRPQPGSCQPEPSQAPTCRWYWCPHRTRSNWSVHGNACGARCRHPMARRRWQ